MISECRALHHPFFLVLLPPSIAAFYLVLELLNGVFLKNVSFQTIYFIIYLFIYP